MAGGEPARGARYKDAVRIQPSEGDRELAVNAPTWPEAVPPGWREGDDAFSRLIEASEHEIPKSSFPQPLKESVLRFPSAPIHGLQRLHEHHMMLGSSENFHTMRILRSSKAQPWEKVSRIFLMHTGLNERDRMDLYYRLASQLIEQDCQTACIVRPFPGHLTRYPFQAFGETPLDLYLWDGSHLFRQFLRFMVETQWLLSAIVRRSSYRCASGANLLGESETIAGSRLDSLHLARAIRSDWMRMHKASARTAKSETSGAEPATGPDGRQRRRPPVNTETPTQAQIRNSIEALRASLNLGAYAPRDGDLDQGPGRVDPDLHVIGYSLGGFTAQSVFMSWPFVISSCSTLLAGGALRELAPTGFADPEEWQTVLHSLRYELDDRLMSRHVGPKEVAIGGIERDLFTYFKRTFYEVFQQEYRGSIQTRYEAFGERMFFVVGGDDPVMRPESVLQSGPKGGLNLLEVGGLGHFLKDDPGTRDRPQQQTFWLPEIATLIDRFATNAADQHRRERKLTWFDRRLEMPEARPEDKSQGEGPVRPLSPTELIAIGSDGALPAALFERCLDDLLYRVERGGQDGASDGVIFILRNEVPAVFLPAQAARETAAAHYHDDLSVARYCHGIAARRKVIRANIDRICLVLPWNARSLMARMDQNRAYPSQAESAGGRVAARLSRQELWDKSLDRVFDLAQGRKGQDSIRVFDGNESADEISRVQDEGRGGDRYRLLPLLTAAGEFTRPAGGLRSVPSLPDCWLWVSSELLHERKRQFTMRHAVDALVEYAAETCGDQAKISQDLREDKLRVVNVSRARFNPRFRGRLLVDAGATRRRLLHAALCVALSESVADQDRDSAFA